MKTLLLLFASLLVTQTYAQGLVDVYHDAVQNDPTFKQAQSKLKEANALLTQAKAPLRPQLQATATLNRTHQPGPDDWKHNNTYDLEISQTLFDVSAYANLQSAKAMVNQATAVFRTAQQDLILRTAGAYFAVLQAQEILRCDAANKTALASTLHLAKQGYRVGVKTIVDVYQAQAEYNKARATYLQDKMTLIAAQEKLRGISNKQYPTLNHLPPDLPVTPVKTALRVWIKRALEHNSALQAVRFGGLVAQYEVRTQQYAKIPTLNLTAGYTYNPVSAGFYDDDVPRTARINLSARFKLYQGGLMRAKERRAQAQYQAASAAVEKTYRDTIANVREDYLTCLINRDKLLFDRQAMKAGFSALKSTRAGYKVGTKTVNDILIQQSRYYQIQTNYIVDRIAYVQATLKLKQDVGSLTSQNLVAIDRYLLPS